MRGGARGVKKRKRQATKKLKKGKKGDKKENHVKCPYKPSLRKVNGKKGAALKNDPVTEKGFINGHRPNQCERRFT